MARIKILLVRTTQHHKRQNKLSIISR